MKKLVGGILITKLIDQSIGLKKVKKKLVYDVYGDLEGIKIS